MGLFKKAVKTDAKLRLAIAGPSGSGKTYSALAIATELGGPIAFVDTEHGSASKYADIFQFDVLELHAPYHSDKYIEAIRGAAQGGYKVVVLDSMSHAWNGEGGLLELVEQATKRQKTPNSYTAWGDVTPIQNRLIEAIVSANIHIIVTMRSKQEYVQRKDERTGRTVIDKVGMAPVQREGFEYEFDIFLDMNIDNDATVSKTRCPEMTGKVYSKPGKQVAAILTKWLSGEPAPARIDRQVEPSTGEIVEEHFPNKVERKAESAPSLRPVITDLDTDLDALGEEASPAALAIISQWGGPKDAQNWAIMVGACDNSSHAGESWMKSVRACKGYNDKNKQEVFLHFLNHQYEKLGTDTQEPIATVA